jgi:hypothetical protein
LLYLLNLTPWANLCAAFFLSANTQMGASFRAYQG